MTWFGACGEVMCSGVTSGAGTWPRLRPGQGAAGTAAGDPGRGCRGRGGAAGIPGWCSVCVCACVCVCMCVRARVRVRADEGEQWSFLIIFKRMKTAQADSIYA